MLSARPDTGFTLIEALIALTVMLAGIAGAAALLLRTVQYERESATRRAVLRQAASLADELRVLALADGGSSGAMQAAIAAWSAEVEASLPAGGNAEVVPDPASGIFRVSIDWPAAGGERQRLTLPVKS